MGRGKEYTDQNLGLAQQGMQQAAQGLSGMASTYKSYQDEEGPATDMEKFLGHEIIQRWARKVDSGEVPPEVGVSEARREIAAAGAEPQEPQFGAFNPTRPVLSAEPGSFGQPSAAPRVQMPMAQPQAQAPQGMTAPAPQGQPRMDGAQPAQRSGMTGPTIPQIRTHRDYQQVMQTGPAMNLLLAETNQKSREKLSSDILAAKKYGIDIRDQFWKAKLEQERTNEEGRNARHSAGLVARQSQFDVRVELIKQKLRKSLDPGAQNSMKLLESLRKHHADLLRALASEAAELGGQDPTRIRELQRKIAAAEKALNSEAQKWGADLGDFGDEGESAGQSEQGASSPGAIDTAIQAGMQLYNAATSPTGKPASEDEAALQWARQNPNDPRAAAILRANGR